MTAVAPRRSVPWVLSDLRTAFLTTLVGMLAIGIGWWGASSTGRVDRQVTWTVVGILGIVALGVGNFLWLLAGRRSVGSRREDLLSVLEGSDVLSVEPGPSPVGDDVVAVDGTARFHRAGCMLVEGKAALPVPASRRGDLRRCEMCRP